METAFSGARSGNGEKPGGRMREWWRFPLLLLAVGCGGPGVWDYVAAPVLADQDWGDRLHLERGGVRVIAGPVAVFPYDRLRADGVRERGQYQLYTRVAVHNSGSDEVEVLWGEAELEVPGGGRIRLVDTREVRENASGEGIPDNAAVLVERLQPGQRTFRALIPATVDEIAIGEPMVPLCDGCVYRLVLVVAVDGRKERMVLPFRMNVTRPKTSSAGAFWRGWED